MGRVAVAAKIDNDSDLDQIERGALEPHQVRLIEVPDALIDTGATMLSLPVPLIEQLGLKRRRTRKIRSALGVAEMGVYGAVRLTIQGRDCVVEVGELAASCPVLIGQIPLEALDWVVDPIGRRLVGNP
jgi:predicted aspartyl protease